MSFLDHKSYEMKKIAECSQDEIQAHLSEFKSHLRDSYMYEQYSPIKYQSDRDVDYADFRKCSYKLGNESVFDLDQIKLLESMGAGLMRYRLDSKDDSQVRNLYVNSGLYAYNQWKASLKEKDNKEKQYRIDGENTLRASVLFFEADFKGDILKAYHSYLSNPMDDISRDTTQKEVSRLVAVLKKEIGRAPNLIMASKNGVHFYYHLHLSLGWTERGLQFLYDLSEESQMAFCEKAGVESVSDIEITLYTKGDRRPLDQQCIKHFVENKFQTVLSKAGFDSACKDVGTRQIRECGFYHTKNMNFPHLIKPAFANLCEGGLLTKDDITIHLTKRELNSLKTQMKKKEKSDLANLENSSATTWVLKGGEMVTYGKSAAKTGTAISIDEIRTRWDSLPLVSGKLNVRLDFLNEERNMGYNSIGGAFINKYENGTLGINLVHPRAPLNDNKEEIRHYVYFSEESAKRAKAKQFNKDLGLSYNDDYKTHSTEENLRKIFSKDPVLKLMFNYDQLSRSVRIHPALSASALQISSDISLVDAFNKTLSENPCSRDLFFSISDEDIQTIKAYIHDTYELEYKDEKVIMKVLGWAFKTSDDTSVKVNILHDKGLKLYQNWVNQGKPAVLDKLADVVGIRKDIDSDYYKYINTTGSGVARGMAVRMYSFDNPSKVEHCLTISGQQENTGKSHLAKSLLKVALDIFGDDGTDEDFMSNRLLARFIAKGNLDVLSEGDFIQRVNGALMILREEAGVDQVNKKSNNRHKEFLTETGMCARLAYGLTPSEINFTHYMVMTTNENRTLYADGGNHRRDLRWGLDYIGKDGKYAWPLLPNVKSKQTVHNPISSQGNKGIIDTKSIAAWFKLALGEALASCVYGNEVRPNRNTSKRTVPCMETGLSVKGILKEVELPEFTQEERDILTLINKEFEQTNDLLKDALLNYLKSCDQSMYKFTWTDIASGVGERLKHTSIKVNNNNLAPELRHLGLETKKGKEGNYWTFIDGSQVNKFAVEGGFTYQSINTDIKSDPLDDVVDHEKENLRKQVVALTKEKENLEDHHASKMKAMEDQMRAMQDQMKAMQDMFLSMVAQNTPKIEDKEPTYTKTPTPLEPHQKQAEIDLKDDKFMNQLALDCLTISDTKDKEIATTIIREMPVERDKRHILRLVAVASKYYPQYKKYEGGQSMPISKV